MTGPDPGPGVGRDPAATLPWLAELVADTVDADGPVDVDAPFAALGIDSLAATALAGTIRRALGRDVAPSALYDHPSVRRLAAHLTGTGTGGGQPATVAGPAASGGPGEPVAVVGIGCRLPGGISDPTAFWRLLRDGVDAVGTVPAGRWRERVPADSPVRNGGFLDSLDTFDASFFGISPREATGIDPQQRLLLTATWDALDDAGIPPGHLAGTDAGVFMGVTTSDYEVIRLGDPDRLDAYACTGVNHSIAANRVSYLLDARGPSLTVDTACSSSLVAVHTAVRALRAGECPLAVVGGVNAILSPTIGTCFTQSGVLSASGRCRTFDADADGYVRAEGATVVVLKPLSRAVVDRDRIYAVILGSAVNSDGRTNGLMAPNGVAQERVHRAACAAAGVDPADVSYVEAHGTGTRVGDLIELGALDRVYGRTGAGRPPVPVGSVKSNLGHLEAAAGVTGLAKVALALHHGALPASLHVRTPNPEFDWAGSRLVVPRETLDWAGDDRRAAVSSFGFGGTNAHAILAPAPVPASPAGGARPAGLLTLSARTPEGLRGLAGAWLRLLDGGSPTDLAAACAAAARRRDHHPVRSALPATDVAELRAALADQLRTGPPGSTATDAVTAPPSDRVTFVFADDDRWPRLAAEPVPAELTAFTATLDESDRELRALDDFPLREALAMDPPVDPGHRAAALVAVQVALAAQWRSWGLAPAAVVGRGLGAVAAAHVAGSLNLRQCLRIAWLRGRLALLPDAERGAALAGALDDLTPNQGTVALLDAATGTPLDGRRLGARHFAAPTPAVPAPVLPGTEPFPLTVPAGPMGPSLLRALAARYVAGWDPHWPSVFPDPVPHHPLPGTVWTPEHHPLVSADPAPPTGAERAAVPRPVTSPALGSRRVWQLDLPGPAVAATDLLALLAAGPANPAGASLDAVDLVEDPADATAGLVVVQLVVDGSTAEVYTAPGSDGPWRRSVRATLQQPPAGSRPRVAPRTLVAGLDPTHGPGRPRFRRLWGAPQPAGGALVGFGYLPPDAVPSVGTPAPDAAGRLIDGCLALLSVLPVGTGGGADSPGTGADSPGAGADSPAAPPLRVSRLSTYPGGPAAWFAAEPGTGPDGGTALRAYDLSGGLRLALDGVRHRG